MSDRDEYESLIDESARRRFEEAWLDGQPEPIDTFLPSDQDSTYLPTLEELAHIELEFAWSFYASQGRAAQAADQTLLQIPLVEAYLSRFPPLQDPAITARLIEQELRVRCDVGQPASLDDYRHRFPDLLEAGSPLESRLAAIAAERATGATHDTHLGETLVGGVSRSQRGAGGGPSGVAGRRFGNYELMEELGRGGMGVVYRARQLSADRIVGLKVIRRDWLESMPPNSRASALDRFRHEAQAAARIEHENIVRVYEVGEVDGEPFFSMQFVDGQSLAELIAEGPLTGRRAAACLEPVARAVDEAHRRGILHRDIKPQNILLDSQTDTPLVADFGLAKLVQTSDELTCAGDVMGSPPYMSPEQARDSTMVTTQSDVYALGATLYHALTGKPPFRAETALDTLAKVVHDEPVPLRQVDPAIDLDLETICLKCLQKESARRYASAAAFADDLACYLSGSPIAARPVGTLERGWLWCRRNPLVATLTTSTAIFLLLTLVASVVGYFRTSAALDTAEKRHRETRRVINSFFTRVSEDRLLNEPGMQPLRKELLHDVLPYYRRFLIEFADDTTIRDELALTHFRIGLITEEIDTPQDALPWYETARKIQEEILEERPGDGDCLRDLGNILTAIGRVLQLQSRYDETRDVYQQAILTRQRLVDSRASDHEARRMLANSHMNLGLLENAVGDTREAVEQYQQAQTLRREILVSDPQNEMTRRDLGRGSYNLGIVRLADPDLPRSERYAEAQQHFRYAATVFEKLLDDDSRDLRNQHRLARCYRMLADLAGEFSVAKSLYDQALREMETLALRNPEVPSYQADLAGLYMNLGELNSVQGELAVALELLGRAEDMLGKLVRQPGSVASYRRDLAVTLQAKAEVLAESDQIPAARQCLERAREYFQQLVDEFDENDDYQADLAGVYVDLGELNSYQGELAVALQQLENAEVILSELVNKPGSVPRYRRDLARTLQVMAVLLVDSDQIPAARKSLTRSRDYYQELVTEFAENDELARGLAETNSLLQKLSADDVPDEQDK